MSGTLNGRTTHDPDCACTRCIGFQRGNGLAVTHGATRSDVALSRDPRVAELAQQIAETQPVSHPADAGACWRLALVYRRIELSARALDAADQAFAEAPLAAYRDGADFLDRLREDHGRWLRLAGAIESDLARTPLSRSKLGLDVALARRALNVIDLHAAAAEEAS